ncbi:hypothetical protein M407DRAFT_29101 [Tulasnella calospora MUT 4182]|uniref:Uncharacterized protein n=1 Tax=Tulasnella calospora MUT 4182 TaxID=1051891 RepID=A0A0C3LIN0_9AGAM|nr:hypothetical protein M407DRAFT_29101 [Tulasnella calospora MUT 4182]
MRDSNNLEETLRVVRHAHTALAQIYDLDLHDSRENHEYLDEPQMCTIAPVNDDPDELDNLWILREVKGIAFQAFSRDPAAIWRTGGRQGFVSPICQVGRLLSTKLLLTR